MYNNIFSNTVQKMYNITICTVLYLRYIIHDFYALLDCVTKLTMLDFVTMEIFPVAISPLTYQYKNVHHVLYIQ